MANFKERSLAPSATDKNWLHYLKGGYNYCILISGSSCLPNCVGYAWGRWRELLAKYHNLSRGNAEDWYGNTKDGYKRGSTPKLGAIACWAKGKVGVSSDGAGHVAVVEKVNSDGSIVTSNSGYMSTRFWTQTIKAPYTISGYTFQGFIYSPAEFTSSTTTTASSKKSNEEIAEEVKAGKWGNGDARKQALTKAGYDYDAIQAIVNKNYGVTTSTIKVGDKVKVLKAVQYNNQPFTKYYDSYDVIEVSNERVVIGKNKVVTCAINIKNIQKI